MALSRTFHAVRVPDGVTLKDFLMSGNHLKDGAHPGNYKRIEFAAGEIRTFVGVITRNAKQPCFSTTAFRNHVIFLQTNANSYGDKAMAEIYIDGAGKASAIEVSRAKKGWFFNIMATVAGVCLSVIAAKIAAIGMIGMVIPVFGWMLFAFCLIDVLVSGIFPDYNKFKTCIMNSISASLSIALGIAVFATAASGVGLIVIASLLFAWAIYKGIEAVIVYRASQRDADPRLLTMNLNLDLTQKFARELGLIVNIDSLSLSDVSAEQGGVMADTETESYLGDELKQDDTTTNNTRANPALVNPATVPAALSSAPRPVPAAPLAVESETARTPLLSTGGTWKPPTAPAPGGVMTGLAQ